MRNKINRLHTCVSSNFFQNAKWNGFTHSRYGFLSYTPVMTRVASFCCEILVKSSLPSQCLDAFRTIMNYTPHNCFCFSWIWPTIYLERWCTFSLSAIHLKDVAKKGAVELRKYLRIHIWPVHTKNLLGFLTFKSTLVKSFTSVCLIQAAYGRHESYLIRTWGFCFQKSRYWQGPSKHKNLTMIIYPSVAHCVSVYHILFLNKHGRDERYLITRHTYVRYCIRLPISLNQKFDIAPENLLITIRGQQTGSCHYLQL